MDVQGRTAFITSGVSGIGLGVAQVFAEAGASLILSYRNEADRVAAQRWFVESGFTSPRFVKLDVTDRAFRRARRRSRKSAYSCEQRGFQCVRPDRRSTLRRL